MTRMEQMTRMAPRSQRMTPPILRDPHAISPMPTPSLLDARWDRKWAADVALSAARTGQFVVVAARQCFENRALRALLAGISWRVITKQDLDDPKLTESQFNVALAAAIERRQRTAKNVTNLPKQRGRHRICLPDAK